ncbi:hypothetical protein [Actinophytocola sp.]|uniref:hypothetical protein n=1 Tax=Actinophytocola sp. TaxID=1872138 RepID=UPI00389A0C6F
MEQIATHIRRLDPTISADTVTALIRTTVAQPARQQRLAWELEANPALLTGQGAQGSPAVVALVTVLVDHGVRGVVLPPCPHCGAQSSLGWQREGVRCCRRCYERPRVAACGRCGQTKPIASRTLAGEPICHPCTRADPLNFAECTQCGRVAMPVVNNDIETLCPACYRPPIAICSVCGRRRPCYRATTDTPLCHTCLTKTREPEPCARCGTTRLVLTRLADGGGLCGTCARRRDTCVACGEHKPVHGLAPEGALCRRCYPTHPVSMRACRECGVVERLFHHDLCTRCACRRKLHDLLTPSEGIGNQSTSNDDSATAIASLPTAAQAVVEALANGDPRSVLMWLRETPPRRVLAAIGTAIDEGCPVTHELLDELEPPQAVTRLRAALVAQGVLPDRDEHLATLEHWLAQYLPNVQDAGERKILRSFVTWHHLRRLRRGFPQRRTTFEQAVFVKSEVRVAVRLLSWLREHGSSLASCDQHTIDQWLAEGTSYHYTARRFLLWTVGRGHAADITVPVYPQDNLRSAFIEDDERWALARRLLNNTALNTVDRVAGLLLLLYAQPLARTAVTTLDQITQRLNDRAVQLRLGAAQLILPSPLDALMLELVDRRHGHAVLGRTQDLTWLFPGGAAGRPISARQLMRRLHRLGIHARLSRNTALMNLAAQLPASVLSDLLNLHVGTATAWNELAGNTRSGYAAELSRRPSRSTARD